MSEHRISLATLERRKRNAPHSIFGASGSHLYLACVGGLVPNVIADLAGYDGNEEAAYGTVAHSVTEEWLKTGVEPLHLIGQRVIVGGPEWDDIAFNVEIDEQMLYYCRQSVDRCEWEPGQHYVELWVNFSHLTPIPNQGGTLDFAALLPGRATVYDHKYGASPENMVMAEENPQLMLYTIGLMRDPAFQHFNLQDFIIRINQPRLDHFDEWHTTRKRLIEFEEYARERMHAAWQIDAPRTPGEKQCRFCRVKSTCAANARFQEELMAGVWGDATTQGEEMDAYVERISADDYEIPRAVLHELSMDQLLKLRRFRHMAKAWWDSLETEVMRRALDKMPDGLKFVESGRSRRKFNNHPAAIKRLTELGLTEDDVIQRVLVSPKKAEDMLLAKRLAARKDLPNLLTGLIYKPPGRAILVPDDDPRARMVDVTEAVFGPVETTETTEE